MMILFGSCLPNKVAPKRRRSSNQKAAAAAPPPPPPPLLPLESSSSPTISKEQPPPPSRRLSSVCEEEDPSALDEVHVEEFLSAFSQAKTLRAKSDLLEDSADLVCELLNNDSSKNSKNTDDLHRAICHNNLFDVVLHLSLTAKVNTNGALRMLQSVLSFCLQYDGGNSDEALLTCYRWTGKLLQARGTLQWQRIPKANLYQIFLFVLRGLDAPSPEVQEAAEELNARLVLWTERALRSHSISARDNLYVASMRVLNQAYEHKSAANANVAAVCQHWIQVLLGTNSIGSGDSSDDGDDYVL